MKSLAEMCVFGLALTCMAGAQDVSRPALRQGISVEMPVASHAVAMPAADEPDATVVTVTMDGKAFLGVKAAELSTLGRLSAGTIYVKADSRVQYRNLLAVLDALRGKSVVLLTAPPQNVAKGKIALPRGMKLTLAP